MSIRKVAVVVVAVCASMLVVPVTAGAQTASAATAVSSLQKVPITGVAKNGKKFIGNFAVDRFDSRGGQTFAIGTLTGKLGNRSIKPSNAAIPVKVAPNPAGTTQARTAAACPVLHLVLGPVNLNLLGLVVTLGGGAQANQPIVLDITAVQGPGNLLGNLLCGVSNLLNGTGVTPLTSGLTTGLLNLVNTLLGNPGVLNL